MIYRYADQAAHDELARLGRSLPRYTRDMGDLMFHKAISYGWGRTDNPGYQVPTHGGDALDFGMTYAIHYLTPGATHALREAFDLWHAYAPTSPEPVSEGCECDPCAGCRIRLDDVGHCPECQFCKDLGKGK